MKPYSNQLFGPTYLPYTVGVSGRKDFIPQKISFQKLRPGYHTTIHVIPKILETTLDFDDLELDQRECKLPHETAGFQLFKEYSQKGCEFECATRKATSFCKCLPWQYPNNFTSLPMCDMFGSHCFDRITSDQSFYKACPNWCKVECQEIALTTWPTIFPLGTIHNWCWPTLFIIFV